MRAAVPGTSAVGTGRRLCVVKSGLLYRSLLPAPSIPATLMSSHATKTTQISWGTPFSAESFAVEDEIIFSCDLDLEKRGGKRPTEWPTSFAWTVVQWSLAHPSASQYMRNLRRSLIDLARVWVARSENCGRPGVEAGLSTGAPTPKSLMARGMTSSAASTETCASPFSSQTRPVSQKQWTSCLLKTPRLRMPRSMSCRVASRPGYVRMPRALTWRVRSPFGAQGIIFSSGLMVKGCGMATLVLFRAGQFLLSLSLRLTTARIRSLQRGRIG